MHYNTLQCRLVLSAGSNDVFYSIAAITSADERIARASICLVLVDSNKILEKTFSKTMERTEKNQQDVLLAWSKLKVGRSLSEKKCFICFNDSPFETIKNAFILKPYFVLKIVKLLACHFGHVEKTA